MHLLVWLVVWAGLTFATQNHHPRLLIAAMATGCLEAGSAAAVYVNQLVLLPRFLSNHRLGMYVSNLFLVIAGSTVLVVTLIQLVYAVFWHPDPRRYGLPFNLVADSIWILLHVAVAAVIARVARPTPI